MAHGQQVVKRGSYMKKAVKRLKEYDHIEFDADKIIASMNRLQGSRRKPTSVALEEETIKDLKRISAKKGIPYQVLMRFLITEGLARLKMN